MYWLHSGDSYDCESNWEINPWLIWYWGEKLHVFESKKITLQIINCVASSSKYKLMRDVCIWVSKNTNFIGDDYIEFLLNKEDYILTNIISMFLDVKIF